MQQCNGAVVFVVRFVDIAYPFTTYVLVQHCNKFASVVHIVRAGDYCADGYRLESHLHGQT